MKRKLFLSDEPIEALTEDAFGHKAFVDTLYKCVKDCDSKINIGLFGNWGVGKTSIINLLVKKLNDHDRKIKTFFFDAWKYSHGSLRQELVLKLNKEYGILNQDELQTEIYCIQEGDALPTQRGWKIELKRIWNRFRVSIIVTIVLVILLILLSSMRLFDVSISFSLVSLILVPIIIDLVIKISSATSSVNKINILPAKLDPERLENKFNDIVNGIINKKNNADKLVIAIDNLDRCSSEAAIEMLEAIKTLMGHDKCVYVLPCDYNALINHLVHIRKYKENDAREFLRKFFHASLIIPSFLDQDLEKFADNMLSQLEIQYSREVLQVVITAFIENPRRIKQFLNNLTTQYLAAQAREEIGVIRRGEITGNDGFLAKILVLRLEFASFYKQLELNQNLLDDIENYFRKSGKPPIYKKYDSESRHPIGSKIFDENPGLEQFLKSTRPITTEDVSPFLKLNMETYPSTIPDAREFKLQVNNGNADYILGNLKKMKTEDEKIEYIKQIVELTQKGEKAGDYAWVFNSVDILIKLYDVIPAAIKDTIATKIGYYLTSAEMRVNLGKFDYDRTFQMLRNTKESYRNDILNEYCDLLIPKKIEQDLIDQFIRIYDLMPPVAVDNLNMKLIEDYTNNREEVRTTIKKLNQKSEIGSKLISYNLIAKIEELIDTSVTDENKNGINLYLELKGRSSIQTQLSFVRKMLNIISTNKTHDYDETKRFGLRTLMNLDPQDIPNEGTEELYDALSQFTGLMNAPNDKLEFIETFFKFSHKFSEHQREQFLKNHVVSLVNSGDPPILANILSKAKKHDVVILSHDIVLDSFSSRLLNNLPDKELLSSMILNTPEGNKEKVGNTLAGLINKPEPPYNDIGLEGFKEFYTQLKVDKIVEICDICLARSNGVGKPDKMKFINPILEAFEKCPVAFKRKFADFILDYIKNDDNDIRNIGIDCFQRIKNLIDKDKKKEIIIKLIREIEQRVNQNRLDQNSTPILNLITEEQAILDIADIVSFIDAILDLLSEAKPPELRLIGLEYLGRINRLYNRRSIVISALESDSLSKDADISHRAKQALESLKTAGKKSTKTS